MLRWQCQMASHSTLEFNPPMVARPAQATGTFESRFTMRESMSLEEIQKGLSAQSRRAW